MSNGFMQMLGLDRDPVTEDKEYLFEERMLQLAQTRRFWETDDGDAVHVRKVIDLYEDLIRTARSEEGDYDKAVTPLIADLMGDTINALGELIKKCRDLGAIRAMAMGFDLKGHQDEFDAKLQHLREETVTRLRKELGDEGRDYDPAIHGPIMPGGNAA